MFIFKCQNPIRFLLLASVFLVSSIAQGATPFWIWTPNHTPDNAPVGVCYFRHTFAMENSARENGQPEPQAYLSIAAQDQFKAFVNGKLVGKGSQGKFLTKFEITSHLQTGSNVIAVEVTNVSHGSAGLAAVIELPQADTKQVFHSDNSWKCQATEVIRWQQPEFNDSHWAQATVVGPFETAGAWDSEELPTVREIIRDRSTTKPNRATSFDAPVFTVAAAKTQNISKSNKNPQPGGLLGRPLSRGLDWLRNRRDKLEGTSNATTNPPSTPQFTSPARTAISPKPSESVATQAATDEPVSRPLPNRDQAGLLRELATGTGDATTSNTGKATSEANALKSILESQIGGRSPRFETRDGFEVEEVIPGHDTGSLLSMTFNEFGDVLAGKEDGPLLIFSDSNDDGTVDSVSTYCDQVTNCQGILALSGNVFVIADGPEGNGLYRLTDLTRDGVLDTVDTIHTFEVSVSEHGPHGIVLGPDGFIYVVVGNHANLSKPFDATSPKAQVYEGDLLPKFEDPGGHARGIKAPGGFIFRTSSDGSRTELFATGLRNAYDLAFNQDGELFTYDSDMESDRGTPWYRPTRLYHVPAGSEFGWRSGWSKWPNYYHDAIPPVFETERGSPTGITFYNHTTYPKKYQNVAFLGDWSQGRILTATLDQAGGSYTGKSDVFLTGKPLNVTDLEVGSDGYLYFVTGGRKTTGGLFRIVWKGTARTVDETGISQTLAAPQINSSPSRQRAAEVQRDLGPKWATLIEQAALNPDLPTDQRIQALQLMQWLGPLPTTKLLLEISQDSSAQVREHAAYFLSQSEDTTAALRLLDLLSDPNIRVKRRAAEALVRARKAVPYEFVIPLLATRDDATSLAGRRLLAMDRPDEWLALAATSDNVRVFLQSATSLMNAEPDHDDAILLAKRAGEWLNRYMTDEDFLDLLRTIELIILRSDLKASELADLNAALAKEFPAKDNTMNLELSKILVRLGNQSIVDRYLELLKSDVPTEVRLQLAINLTFLKSNWSLPQRLRVFDALNIPDDVGNSVPGYLQNVAVRFAGTMNSSERVQTILKGVDYPTAALATLLNSQNELTPSLIEAISQLDRKLNGSTETQRRLKLAILAVLAEEGSDLAMAHLREAYDREPKRRLDIVLGLAEQPQGENWEYLVRSLPLLDGELAQEIIQVLLRANQSTEDPEHVRQLMMLGARMGDNGANDVIDLLEKWHGYAKSPTRPDWDRALLAWKTWYAKRFPDAAQPNLARPSSRWNRAKLLEFLDEERIAQASPTRGRELFSKAQCTSCHRYGDLGESVGPDLTDVATRFQTKELLDSILDPSRVISDQYRSQTVVTTAGKTHTGIIGDGGVGQMLVHLSNGTQIRLNEDDVEETVNSNKSNMPEGLLDSLSVEEIADLFAFLQSKPSYAMTKRN